MKIGHWKTGIFSLFLCLACVFSIKPVFVLASVSATDTEAEPAMEPAAETVKEEVRVSETLQENWKGSLTICKLQENDGKSHRGNGRKETLEKESGMPGIRFSLVRIGTMEDQVIQAGSDAGVGLVYVPTDAGREFLKKAAENGIVRSKNIDGDRGYSTEEYSEILDQFCAIQTGSGEAGEEKRSAGEIQIREFAAGCAEKQEAYTVVTDAHGIAKQTEMDQGLYLVVETDVSDYEKAGTDVVISTSRPYLVSLPMTNQSAIGEKESGCLWMYDVTSYPKNQTGAVSKYLIDEADGRSFIDSADAEIGEKIKQVILSDVPAVLEAHLYEKYILSDEMDPGLSFADVREVRLGLDTGEAGSVDAIEKGLLLKEGEDEDYIVLADPTGRTFSVTLQKKGLEKMNNLKSAGRLAVIFDSVLTGVAKDGSAEANTNQPVLTWKNQNTEERLTKGNTPRVYSYRICLKKDGVSDGRQVSFSVKQENRTLRFEEEKEGIYHPAEKGGVELVHPDADGQLTLRGMDAAAYTFCEKSTEKGKELLQDAFFVVLSAHTPADGNLDHAFVKAGGRTAEISVEKGTASFHVENRPSLTLRAGSVGLVCVLMAGGFLLLCGLSGTICSCRKHKKRGEPLRIEQKDR